MAKTTIKNSTLFYHDWLKTFQKMSDEDVGKICKALLLLDAEDIRTSFEECSILDIVFTQLSATVERNREKYNESCERKSEAAKKREAQKAQQTTTDHNCDDKDKRRIREDKDKDKKRVVSGGEHEAHTTDTTTTTAPDFDEILMAWNNQPVTRQIIKIGDSGKRHDRTEMAVAVAGGQGPFLDAIRSLKDQAYFRKRMDDGGYKVDYDWFVDPENFQNILEGKYEKSRSKYGDDWEVVDLE